MFKSREEREKRIPITSHREGLQWIPTVNQKQTVVTRRSSEFKFAGLENQSRCLLTFSW